MELIIWGREIEPWTWNWLIHSGTKSMIFGGMVGLVLGHINGFMHARGSVYKLFGGESERKPVQSVTVERSVRMSG
jgi:hypothetical protein